MLPIKKVLDLKNELPSLNKDIDYQNKFADAIIMALPQFDNDLNNVYLTYNMNVGNRDPGEILTYSHFINNSDIGQNIEKLIEKKQPSNNINIINPIQVLDINENFSHDIDTNKKIADLIISSLPYFDNEYQNIRLTFPFTIAHSRSGQILDYYYLSHNYENYQEINKHLRKQNPKNEIVFTYNKETGTISENKGFGSVYIQNTLRSSNLDTETRENFLNDVYSALEELIKQLPEDISKIKSFEMTDYKGESQNSLLRPFLSLVNKISSPLVLNFVLKKYPPFKDYYDINSKYYEIDDVSKHILSKNNYPLWQQQLKSYTRTEHDNYLYIYYKNGIIKENDPLLTGDDFKNYYSIIIKEAIKNKDKDFLKQELSNLTHLDLINTPSIRNNIIDIYDMPTRLCKDLDTLQIFKDNGLPFFSYNLNGKTTLLNNSDAINLFKSMSDKNIKSDLEIQNLVPIPGFYDPVHSSFYQDFKNLCELFPDFKKTEVISKYAKTILEYTSAKELSNLFIDFPSIDYTGIDVFYYLFRKRLEGTSLYSQAIIAGADPRICDKFIEEVVRAREDGLKFLKQLNKEGVVVVKNPDYVFSIYNSNPTKNFITYFDKSNDEIFSKYTANGNLVWWGAETAEQLKSKIYKIKDVTQNSKDGRSIFHYFAHKENIKIKQQSFETLVKIVFGPKFDTDNQKFDLSYIYPNGNNLLHELLTFTAFKKNINLSSLNILDSYSQFDLSQQFSQKNNEGLIPLEHLIEQYKLNNSAMFNISTNINVIFNHFGSRIDYSQILKNGKELIEELQPFLSKENKILIENYYINQIAPKNTVEHKNNIRKF